MSQRHNFNDSKKKKKKNVFLRTMGSKRFLEKKLFAYLLHTITERQRQTGDVKGGIK